ncbi:unnamed protein product [Staurois parvus]|uniref:Uncharacterized protein n=1 Tax=Staurois parvus TaxID=386267 RepID=A0ABN9CL96_9NEOB|nr:unnamed protein product [Staurois parvus]
MHVNNTDLSPVSSCTLHSRAIQSSMLTVKQTHNPHSETANSYPLIAPDVNPLCPVPLYSVSAYY